MSVAHPRESFPLASVDGRVPNSDEAPSASTARPWILRFARTPDAQQATVVPATVYDEGEQVNLALYGGPLPFAQTESPTIPDGDPDNPPPLDEGAKD